MSRGDYVIWQFTLQTWCILCFRKRVNLSHGLFKHTISSFEVIAEVPRPLVSAMAVDKSVRHCLLYLLYILNNVLFIVHQCAVILF